MRILLTGATGFIGSHLARHLSAKHELAVLLRPEAKTGRLPSLEKIGWDGAADSLPGLIGAFRPECVIHLASHFIDAHQLKDIDLLLAANLRLPVMVIEAALAAGCKQFVNTGSCWQHYENAAYAPINLYAATKQAFADLLTFYVERDHALKAVTLELADTYGMDDPRPKLIALLKRVAASGENLAMSPGAQWIDFVHVQDIVSAYERSLGILAEMTGGQSVYAVRSGRPIQLKDFVALFNEVSPRPARIAWGGRVYRLRETMQPWTQGEILPGWQPQVDLRDGLREILAA